MNKKKLEVLSSGLIENRVLFFFLSFFLFFGLSILFRLPHFLSNAFWFDGDEAIVGIMAQDLLVGRGFPLYFYGQKYGLSIFEAGAVAIWIKLIGTGIWALRLGGLTLFALGTTFVFNGLIVRGHTFKVSFLVTLALLSFPTWMLWGGMVRGGYVTAFFAISALFYMSGIKRNTVFNYGLFGLLIAIAFEAHVFLLLPILPLLLNDWHNQKMTWSGLVSLLVFSLSFIVIIKSLNFQRVYWPSPALNWDFSEFPNRLNTYLEGTLNMFGDFFYYTINIEIPFWWSILLLVSFLGGIIILSILFFKIKLRNKLYFLLSLIAMVLILILALTMQHYTPRYFISIFTGFFFIYLFYSRAALNSSLISKVSFGLILLFLAGMTVGSKQKRDWYETTENKVLSFQRLYDEVKSENKKAVFVCDNLMQWQWNYLYGQEIPANGFRGKERTMRFTEEVDSIYRLHPKQTAIIGYWGVFYEIDHVEGFNDTRRQIAKDYFIQPIVKKEFHDHGYLKMGEAYKDKTGVNNKE